MNRRLLATMLIAVAAILVFTVVVVVRREPAPPKPVANIGSIRDLKPVTLPATAPETQPPKPDASKDDPSHNRN